MKDCVPVLVFSGEEDALSEALKQFGYAALFFGTTDPLSLDYMRAATSRMNYRCNDPATRKWMARLMRAGEWELLQAWLAEDTLGEEPLPPREDHQLDTE